MDASRQIENLIYRYAELIDDGQLEEVAGLFRAGAIVSPGTGHRSEGYDAVLALYRSSCRIYPDCGTPKTRHLTSNVIIEIEGLQARARSVFTVIQATPVLPLQAIISGRYRDSFVCERETWRFSEREIRVDFIGDCSAHLLYDLAAIVTPGTE